MSTTTTTTTTRSPSMATSRSDRSKKTSKVITLRLSPELLSRFDSAPVKKEDTKSTPSSASSPAPANVEVPTLRISDTNDNASDAASTPAPAQEGSASGEQSKKRKGPAPGVKRSAGQQTTTDGTPKPRGKPGPKKKPRLEDGTIDHGAVKPPTAAPAGVGPHKLGPKANQGAINAGLRALDRSGKPCRKWARKPFQLKSFTGVMWEIPSWKGGETPMLLNGDDSSDVKDISQQSSSDMKPTESDTAMDSNVGDQPDPMMVSTPAASSPPPMPSQSTAITA